MKPWKATYSAVVAGVGSLAAAAPDGINLQEGLIAIGATLTAFGGTYWVDNTWGEKPPPVGEV